MPEPDDVDVGVSGGVNSRASFARNADAAGMSITGCVGSGGGLVAVYGRGMA